MVSPGVHVSRHPLVLHKLAILRDKNTPPTLFRAMVRDLSVLLFVEASADLPLDPLTIETPLAPMEQQRLACRPVLVSILRAGLGMVEPLVELLPEAAVWHLGIYRDHDTLQPVTYRDLLPQQHDRDWAILLDPMLATGGSAITAVDRLLQRGIRRIHFIGFIAAPEGVAALQNAHPEVPIHLAAIDHHLNEHGYIVPGLGDAGDRQFATL